MKKAKRMAEPWIRYKPKNEGKLYKAESPALPYTGGLDPLIGVMETVDYLTTAPVRTGVNESLKASGPWNRFKAFGKGVVKSFKNPGSSPSSSEVATRAGLSDEPIFKNKGRVSYGGALSKLSPADLGGFVGEQVLDPSNLLPVGKAMMLGATATGFKDAKRVFSALWDKKPRFEISDELMKMNRGDYDKGFPFMSEAEIDRYWKMDGPDSRLFKKYHERGEDNLGPKQLKSYKELKKKYGMRDYDNVLENLIDHPELFKNYPELKDVTFEFIGEGKNASFQPIGAGHINLGKDLLHDKAELKKTLLHEIQHWVQEEEGFARGGSSGEFVGDLRANKRTAESMITEINEKLSAIAKRMDFLKQNGFSSEAKKGTPGYEALLANKKEYDDLFDKKMGLVKNAQIDISDEAHNQYKRLAGEAEARDTEARINMSEAERMRTQPLKSTGLALNDLIVRGVDERSPNILKGLAPVGPWMLYKRNREQNKKETVK